ncbi:MAG: hypothetical protein ACI4I8_01855 [Oscillospiraceae bacterium]
MDSKLKNVLHRIETGDVRSAQIYELIDTYYQRVIYKVDEYDDDEGPEGTSYPEELLKPLAERESGIAEALSVLIDQGYDVHESDGRFNALMLSVGNADEPMMAFLLDNGADPYTWPDMDQMPEECRENFYLEDIDIHYMDACDDHDEAYKAMLLRTAQTFVRLSGLRNVSGLCLLVDVNGRVSLEPPKNKY